MSSITQQLFNVYCDKLVAQKKFTDELYDGFLSLFGEEYQSVVGMIECRMVKKLVSPTDRFIFQVSEEQKTNQNLKQKKLVNYHYCFVKGNYCNCVKFKFDGLATEKMLWCRHLIAAKLALVLDCFEVDHISEEDFYQICQCNMLDMTLNVT